MANAADVLNRLKSLRMPTVKWGVLRALIAYWAFVVGSGAARFVIYMTTTAEGISLTYVWLGRPLARLPFLHFLGRYEGWHQLSLAHVLALLLLIVTCAFLRAGLRLWLEAPELHQERWSENRQMLFCLGFGVAIVAADAYMFYRAVVQAAWGGWLSIPALVMCVAYVCLLVGLSFISVNLQDRISDQEASA